MIEADGIESGSYCPECGKQLLFDVTLEQDCDLVVHIYCEDDDCDYYTFRTIDPIKGEIY